MQLYIPYSDKGGCFMGRTPGRGESLQGGEITVKKRLRNVVPEIINEANSFNY